ncbi:MAG: S41 family peptidase [Caulobacteraceae bacterium]
MRASACLTGLFLLAAAVPGAAQTSAAPAAPTAPTAQDWRTWARQDLQGMHDVMRDNHPMMLTTKDSAAMRAWLEEGYRQGLRQLPKVKDSRGYAYLLGHYGTGFRDGHVGVGPKRDQVETGVVAWPGFATGWRGGVYYVAYADPAAAPGAPPLGAELVSCDGKSTQALADERLDLWEGDLHLPTGRYRRASRLLWDMGNPFVVRPNACVFAVDSASKTYRLNYRPVEKAVTDAAAAATGAFVKVPHDVTPWGSNRWWIGMPTMDGGLDWKGFFAKVDANLEALRNAEVVVIDVRGNGGGDSTYADILADKLWGEAVVKAYHPRLGPSIYRATPLNRNYLANLFAPAANDPLQADSVPEYNAIIAGLDAAIAAGEPTYTRPSNEGPAPVKPTTTPMKARVILLTDYACGSACLDLMDLFQALPNVRQAGTSTGADTIFMELTITDSPSGKAKLYFGHKIWIERPRGSNVTYNPAPEWTYSGVVSDDTAWKSWLEKRLAAPQLKPID